MNITNRTGNTLTIRTFNAYDNVTGASEHTDWIHPGQTCQYEHNADKIKIFIYEGEVDPAQFFARTRMLPVDVVGDFDWDTSILLVRGQPNKRTDYAGSAGSYGAVNWTFLYSKYSSIELRLSSSSSTVNAGAQAADILLNALALGLAASSKYLAFPAGFVLGAGSLIVMLFTDNRPPTPPPELSAITDAVKKVVGDALAQDTAEKAATTFHQAANWCIKWAQTAYAVLHGSGAGPQATDLIQHNKDDFLRQLEDWVSDQSSFQQFLAHLKVHSEIAKFVIPALKTGLISDLQIQRMHLTIRILNGLRVTDLDIEPLKTRVNEAIKALTDAKTAFQAFLKNTVSQDMSVTLNAMDWIDEVNALYAILTKHYTGRDNLDFVDAAIKQLTDVAAGLEQDCVLLKGGQPPERFWPLPGAALCRGRDSLSAREYSANYFLMAARWDARQMPHGPSLQPVCVYAG
jgi:hypothetical protein